MKLPSSEIAESAMLTPATQRRVISLVRSSGPYQLRAAPKQAQGCTKTSSEHTKTSSEHIKTAQGCLTAYSAPHAELRSRFRGWGGGSLTDGLKDNRTRAPARQRRTTGSLFRPRHPSLFLLSLIQSFDWIESREHQESQRGPPPERSRRQLNLSCLSLLCRSETYGHAVQAIPVRAWRRICSTCHFQLQFQL
jgi:hypothetical protein